MGYAMDRDRLCPRNATSFNIQNIPKCPNQRAAVGESEWCTVFGERIAKGTITGFYPVLHYQRSPLGTPFYLKFPHSQMARGRVVNGFRRRNNQENHGRAKFHTRSQETTAQFLVIGLWKGVHAVENKVNKVSDFVANFKSHQA